MRTESELGRWGIKMKYILLLILICSTTALFARERQKEASKTEREKMTDEEKSIYWNAITNEWRIQREESAIRQKAQQAGICHVHNIKMFPKTIEIGYGLPKPSKRTHKKMLLGYAIDNFPHADREKINGGCIVSTDSPKTKDIFVCPKCSELKKEWESKNKLPNKELQPTVKTPVESGNEQGTAAEL